MKQIGKRITAAALCAAMLFTTACSSESSQENDVPMGRYVETALSYPEGEITKQLKRSDGSIDLYLVDKETDEDILYNSKDGGATWEQKEIPWAGVEDLYLPDLIYDENDEIYALSYTMTGGFLSGTDDPLKLSYDIFHVEEDGSLLETGIKWATEHDTNMMVDQFLMGDNGDIFVLRLGDGITQYDWQTKEIKQFYQMTAPAEGAGKTIVTGQRRNLFAVGFGKLFMGDTLSSSVMIYDTDSGELQMTVPFENLTADSLMTLGSEGELYIQNTGGLYRLVENGTIWEQVIDGALTSMSMPLGFTDLFKGEDEVFYVRGNDASIPKLFYYKYDETIAVTPEYELTVYALKDNMLVRHAVGIYQRQHPDTRVNLQVAPETEGVSKSELIRVLNTELLAGKGPDILFLDDMNIQSYVEKGALLDISDTLKQSGNLLDNITNSIEKDGAVYAVPVQFRLPVFAAENSVLSQTASLREAADFAQEHQEIPLLGLGAFESLIYGSAPAFFKDGVIDQKALREFLTCIKDINDVTAEEYQLSYQERGYEETLFDFAFGRSHGYTESINGMHYFNEMNAALMQRGDCDIQPLPGLSDNVFLPRFIAGVNANTQQPEKAKAFIKMMLSEEIQSLDLYYGLPVNQDVLSALISDKPRFHDYQLTGSNPEEVIPVSVIPLKMQERLYELILSAKTPVVLDSVLIDAIKTEANGYFEGSKTIDQTLADIEEATKLYLAE